MTLYSYTIIIETLIFEIIWNLHSVPGSCAPAEETNPIFFECALLKGKNANFASSLSHEGKTQLAEDREAF